MPITNDRTEELKAARAEQEQINAVAHILKVCPVEGLKTLIESTNKINAIAASKVLAGRGLRNLRIVPTEIHPQTFCWFCLECGACACERCWKKWEDLVDLADASVGCQSCGHVGRVKRERNHRGEWKEVN